MTHLNHNETRCLDITRTPPLIDWHKRLALQRLAVPRQASRQLHSIYCATHQQLIASSCKYDRRPLLTARHADLTEKLTSRRNTTTRYYVINRLTFTQSLSKAYLSCHVFNGFSGMAILLLYWSNKYDILNNFLSSVFWGSLDSVPCRKTSSLLPRTELRLYNPNATLPN
jgi:hypothetical protein